MFPFVFFEPAYSKKIKVIKYFADLKSMPWFFYIFFIISFFINFTSKTAVADALSSEKVAPPLFKKTGCAGREETDQKCGITTGTGEEEAEGTGATGATEATGANSTSGVSKVVFPDAFEIPEGASMVCSSVDATECCSDPTTCLGGDALSSFENINNTVSTAGPAAAMAIQSLDGKKDMSGMCEAMQGLAGGGAALSLVASQKCKGAISSCRSSCDNAIKRACNTYINAKKVCLDAITSTNPQKKNAAEVEFQSTAEPASEEIYRHERVKLECVAQTAKSEEVLDSMSQLITSALSAEMCKQQGRLIRNKEECKKSRRQMG